LAPKLAGWPKTEANRPRKERRTLKRMHADLVALGYTGSYSRVAAFAREWRADRQRERQSTGRGTFVPLSFRPGEAFQFDWSEDFAIIGGERTKLQMAHIKLSHSRAFLARAPTCFRPMTSAIGLEPMAPDGFDVRRALAWVACLWRRPGAGHLR